MMKRYTLFAGVNGSGKTTIYKSVFFDKDYVGKRINTDEMVARLGSWKDNDLQMKAAREALAGKSILVNINKAKKNGFYVVMNYIGLENYDIAKERVKFRVSKGGHGIPDDTIEKRYIQSLENLKEAIELCDEVNIYDNTNQFVELINIKDKKIKWMNNTLPKWAKDVIKNM